MTDDPAVVDKAEAQAEGTTWALPRPHSKRRSRGWLVRRTLLAADVTGLAAAFGLAEALFGSTGRAWTAETGVFVATLPGWLVVAKLYELYDHDEEFTEHGTVQELIGVFHLVTVGAWLFFVGSRATGVAHPVFPKLAVFWLLAIAFVTLARSLARALCRRSRLYVQKAIVVGAGDVGQLVARKLTQHREYRIDVAGFVDSEPLELRPEVRGLPLLGAPESLPALVRSLGIDRVVVAFSRQPDEEALRVLRVLKGLDVQIDIVPRLFDVIGPNTAVHSVESVPLLALPTAKPFPFSRLIKRTIDVVGSLLLLAAFAPLFAYCAWRVSRDSPGPVFFRQLRIGHGMREFTALKFRTMKVDTDDSVHREFIKATMSSRAELAGNGIYKLDRDSAVTPFGRWLRKTSLDELPQLLNVLRGDMSLVGPRPCIPYEVESFEPHHFERFLVPAGITGLWQVTARARSTFGEALDMDVVYARNWSLALDLQLLLRTPFQILRQRGATA